jgi:acetyl-CoA carboxylase biotin carboxylase subunit
MFKKVLIANRGEIACRVIKACQEMGIKAVAVYSEVDEMMPHVALADEAHPLGDPAPLESYLNIDKILQVAMETGAEAVHPGYGFLAENPVFAEQCEKHKLKFIGPPSEVIRRMGSKIEAKALMEGADVPVIPGFHSCDAHTTIEELMGQGVKIGFPLMVKASAGGGGKGMRIVHRKGELRDAIEGAEREALSAFGDGTIFLERYLEEPRHIEFQILADEHGKVIHLFERECSIQRRHQKVIEETPSPALTPELRKRMGEAAVKAAQAVGYTNAGTVEFMFSKGEFYFLEMNTRLQVEHPITEFTTGIDIVKWQLRIAAGEPLALEQDALHQRGHAIECRIYAEDPENEFLPSTGILSQVTLPHGPNVRHDVGVETGCEISPHYDPMIGKLVTYAENRDEAINKMIWALSNYVAIGVTTNIDFLKRVLAHQAFKEGHITTHFIADHLKEYAPSKVRLPIEVLVAAGIFDHLMYSAAEKGVEGVTINVDKHSPWTKGGGWRIGGP